MSLQRADRDLPALTVLALLLTGQRHTYEMHRLMIDTHKDFVTGLPRSMYHAVERLMRAELIRAVGTDKVEGRPERTVYALTDAGRHEVRDWLRELVAEPQHEYPHFVAALSLIAALPPDEVVDLLGTRLRRLAEQRAEIRSVIDTARAADVHPLFLVEEEYRLAMLDAESTFVQRFIEQITHPDTGWGRPWAEFHRESLTERRTS